MPDNVKRFENWRKDWLHCELRVVEAPSSQSVGQQEGLVQKQILEAIQHLSTRMDQLESKPKSQNYTDRKKSSSLSPVKPSSPPPTNRRDPVVVGFPDRGDPDDGDDDDGWNDE